MQHPPAHPPPTRTDGCGFDRNNAALDSKWGFGGRTREGWRRETQGGEGRSGWEGARRRSHLLHLLLCCFCPREQKRLVLCACSERTPRALCSPRARRQETSPPSDRGRAWVPLIRRSPTQLASPSASAALPTPATARWAHSWRTTTCGSMCWPPPRGPRGGDGRRFQEVTWRPRVVAGVQRPAPLLLTSGGHLWGRLPLPSLLGPLRHCRIQRRRRRTRAQGRDPVLHCRRSGRGDWNGERDRQ